MRLIQGEFICNTRKHLLEISRKVNEDMTLDVIEDIVVCFDNGEEEEYTTSQQHI